MNADLRVVGKLKPRLYDKRLYGVYRTALLIIQPGLQFPAPLFFLTSIENVLKCIRQVIVYNNTKSAATV